MGGDAYGYGVPMVVVGVTPHQGDGNAGHRAKWDRLDISIRNMSEVSRNATVGSSEVLRDSKKTYSNLTGEPCSGKLGCRVRRGAVGKVL